MAPPTFSLLGLLIVSLCLAGCSDGPMDGQVQREFAISAVSGGAGAGSVPSVSCEDSPLEARAGSCTPTDQSSACQLCVEQNCCAEQAACNALRPDESCAFGSTLYQGKPLVGEITCMMECFVDRRTQGSFQGDGSDVDECASRCAASECDRSTVGGTTRLLAECIAGSSHGAAHCQSECGLGP